QDAVHQAPGRRAGGRVRRRRRARRGGMDRGRVRAARGRERSGVRRHGGAVPHQRPVAAARRGLPVPGHPLPADRSGELLRAAGTADPATALETVIAVTGYDQYLAEEGVEGAERLDNVRELVAGAAGWAEVAPAGEEGDGSLIERYLTQASLLGPTDEATGDP